MKWEAWRSLANDDTHWQNVEEKGLLKAEPLGDHRLQLWFEATLDVAIYELDFIELRQLPERFSGWYRHFSKWSSKTRK